MLQQTKTAIHVGTQLYAQLAKQRAKKLLPLLRYVCFSCAHRTALLLLLFLLLLLL